MIIVHGKLRRYGASWRTPVSEHVPPGTVWRDDVSGDGAEVMTVIDGDLDAEVIAAMKADPDILQVVDLPDGPIPANAANRIAAALGRRGVPPEAVEGLGTTATGADVADVLRRQVRLGQVVDLARMRALIAEFAEMRGRLERAGFDTSEMELSDTRPSALRAMMKTLLRRRSDA